MQTEPTTVAELRAQIAAGAEKAAARWQREADKGLPGAAEMAARLREDAERNAALAR